MKRDARLGTAEDGAQEAEGRAFCAGAALQLCQPQAFLCRSGPFAFAAVLNLGTAADLLSGA